MTMCYIEVLVHFFSAFLSIYIRSFIISSSFDKISLNSWYDLNFLVHFIFLKLKINLKNKNVNSSFQHKQGEKEQFSPYMSRDVRKQAFCICENKDADQLRGNREADQRLCFRYTDSTIPLLPKSEISSL